MKHRLLFTSLFWILTITIFSSITQKGIRMKHLVYSFVLFILLVCSTHFINAQWSTDPNINNPICTAPGIQRDNASISDGAGGAIITWTDHRSGSDIYAQRINAYGVVQWAVNGVAISTATNDQFYPAIASDGTGGAIITWLDNRNGPSRDIYAQRINAAGVVQWTANGVVISTIENSQHIPEVSAIISDGSNGAIIAWRVGSRAIYAQRINDAGLVQWIANGVAIKTSLSTVANKDVPTIVSDGGGGAIITWEDSRSGGAINAIYAQRIDASGAVQWTTNGIFISTATTSSAPFGASDGIGGAIITWDNGSSIYAQRINAAGAVQWTSNGVSVSTGVTPQISSDGTGGAIITWNRGGTNYDVYAQRINGSGVVQWATNGVGICTAPNQQFSPAITSDDAGGAIITWEDRRRGDEFKDIYAQRINGSGAVQWTTNGVAISTGGSLYYSTSIVSDGAGGAVIAWSGEDIYAQWVNASGGNLGTLSSISGMIFLDTDGDCIQDSNEPELQNWVVKLEPGPLYAITGSDGKYLFEAVLPGAYTISEIAKPFYGQTCPPFPGTYLVNLLLGQNITGKDFGNQIVQSVQDLTVSVGSNFPSPLQSACCGQEMTYQINYSNLGTAAAINASLEVILSPDAQYQSTTMSDPLVALPTQSPGNILVYALPTPLLPGASGEIDITVLLTCIAPSAPLIISSVRIDTTADVDQTNNTVSVQDQVSCSYDPNDMSVTPQGCGVEGYITAADSLSYLIRFQNLGSGPAYHVVVRDTLDSDLDISTVTTLGSSHPYVLTTNGNELVWTFWGIVLPPETTDEAGSHGYIRFKVKQQVGNIAGTVIQSRAGIYFDLNDVVLTNQTTNTITLDPMPVADFTVTPNCVGNNCTYTFSYTGGTAGAMFEWNFGSGAIPQTSTDENPTGIIYSTFSSKVVSLRVMLGSCVSEPAVKTITNPSGSPQFNVARRWNLVSLPYDVPDFRTSALFPTASSSAFAFEGSYNAHDTLKNGVGYWVKFPYQQNVFLNGTPITFDTIVVVEGWNLVGSISSSVPVGTITSIPPGLVTTQFFEYNNGYSPAMMIEPGKGYWVKVNQNGQLILSSLLGNQLSVNRITIVPTSEMPPSPPEPQTRNQKPETFNLDQNYPNPFNPTTLFSFHLPVSSYVTLKVYDVLGEEVATLVDGFQDAGIKTQEWNASNLSSGVYYYRLVAGEYSNMKKLLLMK